MPAASMAAANRAARSSKSCHEVSVVPCWSATWCGSASLMASQMVARCCSTHPPRPVGGTRSDLGGSVVDGQLGPGDGAGGVTGQEEDGVGDVLRAGDRRVEPVLAHRGHVRGVVGEHLLVRL